MGLHICALCVWVLVVLGVYFVGFSEIYDRSEL